MLQLFCSELQLFHAKPSKFLYDMFFIVVSHLIFVARRQDYKSQGFNKWAFMTTHSWDEDPKGTWTLEIHDRNSLSVSGGYYIPFHRGHPEYKRVKNSEYNRTGVGWIHLEAFFFTLWLSLHLQQLENGLSCPGIPVVASSNPAWFCFVMSLERLVVNCSVWFRDL